MTGITYIATDEGWLYLADIKDPFNGELVGYALDARMTQQLVMQALFRAVAAKRPGKGLIHHSDRGSQYCAHAYQKLWRQFGMQASMSRKGNCWENERSPAQRANRALPGFSEDRTGASPSLRNPQAGQARDHGIYRDLLQPDSKAGTTRPSVARLSVSSTMQCRWPLNPLDFTICNRPHTLAKPIEAN